jgi:hypothetical protein
MRRLHLALFLACAPVAGCYPAPYPVYPTTVTTPADFDRSWSAAHWAANDVGVVITLADRANGVMQGMKDGAGVTITLQQQADGTLKLVFSAPESKESNPSLQDRFVTAYNRRMGR